MLYLPFLNYADGSLDAALRDAAAPDACPGLSDGGAHVGMICDGSFPTSILTHWTRDRTRGPKLAARAHGQARRRRDTAEAVGLFDRGLLAPGYRADLNVIDYDRLTLHAPEVAYDLPAGGRRLIQRAEGYAATIVAGEVTYRDGEPTGALPGRLLRGAQAAPAALTRRAAERRSHAMTPRGPGDRLRVDRASDVADPAQLDRAPDRRRDRELDAALAHARAQVRRPARDRQGRTSRCRRSAARLKRIEHELIDGRGFVLIRGLPRERYDNDEMCLAYWGIGAHLGKPWPQNKHGHVLGDVTDQGKALDDPTARGNELGADRPRLSTATAPTWSA